MHRFSAVLFLFGTLACSAPALEFQSETPSTPAAAIARDSDPDATVCMVGEVTGDTFRAYCGGRNERIRVNGIDAPELRQSYGLQSSIEASRLLGYGSNVTLHAIEYDRYGRLVARVTLADGRDLARELVRAGYAWHYVRYSRDPELGKFETEARDAKRGLWVDAEAEEPAAYRQRTTAAAREQRGAYARRSGPRSQRRSLAR
jgi:endonuclease YncB( thermonuclease family)